MNSTQSTKFKDSDPKSTIRRINSILQQLGTTTAKDWLDSEVGTYSLRLTIAGTDIGTNGKGTSHLYALASAYGEFVERFQNLLLSKDDLTRELLQYGDFYYAPDEKVVSAEEIKSCRNGIVDVLLSRLFLKDKDAPASDSLFQILDHLNICDDSDKFIAVPYYDFNTDEISYVPYVLTAPLGSTGMCAGNTPEESIVQGISEILERYVQYEIIQKSITPPTIPRNYINEHPEIAEIIRKIEKSGWYDVILKDCSLGKGYPVVCSIVIDRHAHSYRVCFGAHPSFRIAAERSLTELFQGNSLSGLINKIELDFSNEGVTELENFISLTHKQYGKYPVQLFDNEYCYDFKPFKEVSSMNNRELLRHLLDKLLSEGHHVLVRDVGFLGFPSHHILIPDMNSPRGGSFTTIHDRIKYFYFKGIMNNLFSITDEQLKQLSTYILYKLNHPNQLFFFSEFCPHTINELFNDNFMAPALFVALSDLKQGCCKSSSEILGSLLSYLENQQLSTCKVYSYIKCLKALSDARSYNIDDKKANQIISLFYPAEIAEFITKHTNGEKNIFSLMFQQATSYDCDDAPGKDQYWDIRCRRKELMLNNMPDQKLLRKLYASYNERR
ncbi:MAG TPA: YcaO-like family protein [Methanosarcinales archaeon]|nr:YcaO-like family protein [Methanosarcinales archaeon]